MLQQGKGDEEEERTGKGERTVCSMIVEGWVTVGAGRLYKFRTSEIMLRLVKKYEKLN